MIAYLDLPSGLSGDMLLGCLVDSGWPLDRLRHAIDQLDLPEEKWALHAQDVLKGPLRAKRVEVLADESHHRRGLADIRRIIDSSELPILVKDRGKAVFGRLANAEARVHGTSPEQVHFHEVGAVDAIIDIVGTIAGFHELGVTQVYSSGVPLGSGWTDSAHGRLPIPAPATLELIAAAGMPTRPSPGPGELLTPTAAAILAELATFTQPQMTLSKIGIGAGQKDFAWPNIARMWLGEAEGAGPIVQIETNIDDMNPQLYSAVSDRLFAAGALDVWFTPVLMKKGRPGIVLSVLGKSADESLLAEILLRETTTLGVRVRAVQHRHEARRTFELVNTPFGDVRTKIKWIGEEAVGAMPEYEDCRKLADELGASIRTVHEAATAASATLLRKLCASSPGPSVVGEKQPAP